MDPRGGNAGGPGGNQRQSSKSVFVGNIPYDASEEQLIEVMAQVGPVVSFRPVMDRETGKPKGFGFVEYRDSDTAMSAMRNLNNYEFNGRNLRVDFAEDGKGGGGREMGGRTGGGGGGGGNMNNNNNNDWNNGGGGGGGGGGWRPNNGPNGPQGNGMPINQPLPPHQPLPPPPQQQPQVAQDPFSPQLASALQSMSPPQLYEVLSKMKLFIASSPDQARQLLLSSPSLSTALLNALIVVGMVTPGVVQQIVQHASKHTPGFPPNGPPNNQFNPPVGNGPIGGGPGHLGNSLMGPGPGAQMGHGNLPMGGNILGTGMNPLANMMGAPNAINAMGGGNLNGLPNLAGLGDMQDQKQQVQHLLQQVMSLTPQQIENLPPQQRIQVLQLKQWANGAPNR